MKPAAKVTPEKMNLSFGVIFRIEINKFMNQQKSKLKALRPRIQILEWITDKWMFDLDVKLEKVQNFMMSPQV